MDREKERLLTADIVESERAGKAQAEREIRDLKHRLEIEEVEKRRMVEAAELQQIIVRQQEELRVRADHDRQVQLLANAVGPFFNSSNAQMQNSIPNPFCPSLPTQNAFSEVPENLVPAAVSSTSEHNNSTVRVSFKQPVEEQTPTSHSQPPLTDGQSKVSSLKASYTRPHTETSTEASGSESEENQLAGFQSVQTPNAT